MALKAGVRNVRPHTRNGSPVSGYTQRYTIAEKWSAIMRGERPGSVRKAWAMTLGAGVVTSLWAGLSLIMTAEEAAFLIFTAACLAFGVKGYLGHRRKGIKWGRNPIIFSPVTRLRVLRNVVKKKIRRLPKTHPWISGPFYRYLVTYEVTQVKGKGKSRKAYTTRVRGAAKRDTLLAHLKERERQRREKDATYDGFSVTSRQLFP